MSYELGIDIGGTFTDFVLLDKQGGISVAKVESTPANPLEAMSQGLELLSQEKGLSVAGLLNEIAVIIHGTTVATNAMIQQRFAKAGLLCTKGFRDILEHRQGYKEERFDYFYPPPPTLVPRYLRLPVEERIRVDGEIDTPLNENDVRANVREFKEQGVESVAICFLWSCTNPVHENKAREIVAEEFPEAYISTSGEILPQIGEYTRVSTTAVNTCLGPIIKQYVEQIEAFLQSLGYKNEIRYIQANGGITSGELLKRKPVLAINSGPAAAPAAGLHFGRLLGTDNVLTLDMGGTSCDVCAVHHGVADTVKNIDVHRLRIGVPMINISTVGAGGGSIAWIDRGGRLRVGPQSAEAVPGPACYGKGAEHPTVTDANVVLGYFNPSYLLGGRMPIHGALSRKAIREGIGDPLQLSDERAALGILNIANMNMVGAIRQASIERGYDSRDFVLVAAGGCGPAHAGRLAEALGVSKVLIPKIASVFCSFGAVVADIRHDYSMAYRARFSELSHNKLTRLYVEMERKAFEDLKTEGIAEGDVHIVRTADARYLGQAHDCTITIPRYHQITEEEIAEIEEIFHGEHKRRYTFEDRWSGCELINLGVTAHGMRPGVKMAASQLQQDRNPEQAKKGERKALFEEYDKPVETPVYDGGKIQTGTVIKGPAVVEEETTTIVVFPRWQLHLDTYANVYVMTLQ